MNANTIDFSGTVPEQITIRQESIGRLASEGGGDVFIAILTVSCPGLSEVRGTIRFGYDDYVSLTVDEDTRKHAVRAKLVEKLTENWHNGFSFLFAIENGRAQLLSTLN